MYLKLSPGTAHRLHFGRTLLQSPVPSTARQRHTPTVPDRRAPTAHDPNERNGQTAHIGRNRRTASHQAPHPRATLAPQARCITAREHAWRRPTAHARPDGRLQARRSAHRDDTVASTHPQGPSTGPHRTATDATDATSSKTRSLVPADCESSNSSCDCCHIWPRGHTSLIIVCVVLIHWRPPRGPESRDDRDNFACAADEDAPRDFDARRQIYAWRHASTHAHDCALSVACMSDSFWLLRSSSEHRALRLQRDRRQFVWGQWDEQ
jgi:hypothetical protein